MLKLKISGKVQGVFFRASAKNEANKLKLFGYAKNMPDGTVMVEAEGEMDELNLFLDWCRKGPSEAKVEKVEFEFFDNLQGYNGFKIC